MFIRTCFRIFGLGQFINPDVWPANTPDSSHLAKTQVLYDAQIYLYNVNKRQ